MTRKAKYMTDETILYYWKKGHGLIFDCMEDARAVARRCGLPEKWVAQVTETTPCGLEFLTNYYVYMGFLVPTTVCGCDDLDE